MKRNLTTEQKVIEFWEFLMIQNDFLRNKLICTTDIKEWEDLIKEHETLLMIISKYYKRFKDIIIDYEKKGVALYATHGGDYASNRKDNKKRY